MSSGWTPGLDEVPPGVTAAIRDRVLATVDELGPEAVLWLAAPPLWTLGIAEAAGFPASPLIEFVRRACDASWGKARGPLADGAPPDLVFWMPAEARRAAMDELRIRGGVAWITMMQRIALSVAQVTGAVTVVSAHGPAAAPPWDEVPGALTAWVELINTTSLEYVTSSGGSSFPADLQAAADISRFLFSWTQEAVASGDLGRAQDLVAAGEAIAGVLAGPTEQALSQAQRMVTLGQRRRQDERALGRYLDRPELSGAVDRLLARDAADGRWALHLRGAGGVGKTMLIKYLASGRYAADRGLTVFPVIRADFDYISPDYPVRRPVQLLLELADELVLHTAVNARADRALAFFRANAARAHEAASGRREATGSPLDNEEVARAVDSFGDVLAELGDVLLVLDTCEELAKADLGNPASPAVRAMLGTVERLHQRAPSARVLLAGRRPLPARPYLTVQEVDGFTQDEARRYLAASRGRPLPPELAEEMIRQSPSVDGAVPPPGQLPDRVSPFDLALYAAWAEDDPDLDVAEVRRGSDAYVEGRIISRLGDPLVVAALPLLAAAGRCRVATLAEVLGGDPGVIGRRLAEQEWIVAGGDPVTHVAARPALLRSLRRYFGSDERRGGFAAQIAALGAALLTRAREVPLTEIDPDELVAALRLTEPADAAALWDSVAERAMEPPGRWGIALNLTRRLLGEWEPGQWEDGAWPTMPALRATVTAAHIAGSRRDNRAFHARGSWDDVRSWAGSHPDPEAGQILSARAALGLLPYRPEDESLWESIAATLSSRLPPDRAGLAAAAAEAGHRLLEAGHMEAARRFSRYLLTELTPKVTRRSYAWARIVQARTFAEAGSGEAVLDYLLEAQDLAQRAVGPEPSWPDWIPPEDLLARIWIERCLITPPSDVAALGEWEAYAAGHLDSVDGERLASLCLRIRLRHGPVDAATAARWEAADSYLPDRQPSCTAHDLVPPLFVSVAQAWFSAGEAERALALLDRRRVEALGTRQDELTVRHADAATVGIARRLRLTDRQSVLARLAAPAPAIGESGQTALGEIPLQAWRAQAVTDGSGDPYRRFTMDVPETWHAWWQCLGPGPNAVAYLIDRSARPPWRPASTSAGRADIAADLTEVELLAPRISGSRLQSALVEWAQACSDWLGQSAPPPLARSAEPHREVRAAIRTAALAGENFEFPPRVPSRLLAEMAFEEAELTALRLPQAAARLFLIAARAYQEADDPLGEYLARLSVLLAGPWSDGPADARRDLARRHADAAHAALARRMPTVADALDAPLEETGPWRNWTPAGREVTAWVAAVREAAIVATRPGSDDRPAELALRPEATPDPGSAAGSARPEPAPDAAEPAGRHRPVSFVAGAVSGLLTCAGAVVALMAATVSASSPSTQGGPRGGGASPLPWIAALLGGLAVLVALAGWYGAKVVRLATGRGVGASRLGTLQFDATVAAGSGADSSRSYAVSLHVRARPWRSAPRRARAALWLLSPGVRLAKRSRNRGAGYYASGDATPDTPTAPPCLTWVAPRPAAGPAWWRRGRGTAAGIIRVRSGSGSYAGETLTAPWERMLAASLSPGAAGRIEWMRLVSTSASPRGTSAQPESMLVAPAAWIRALSQYYASGSRPAVWVDGEPRAELLHVIGRAVATSAGPSMDLTDPYAGRSEPQPNPLSVTDIERLRPVMVVLQAEPAPGETIGTGSPDDQDEKLRLGAALAADGVRAVLLLPVLPAGITDELARILTTQDGLQSDDDVTALLTRVRAAVAPHVPPPVLDDVVLFLNVASYRT